jgi:hypothetical protein
MESNVALELLSIVVNEGLFKIIQSLQERKKQESVQKTYGNYGSGYQRTSISIILLANFWQFHIFRNIKLFLNLSTTELLSTFCIEFPWNKTHIDCYSRHSSGTTHVMSEIATADRSESTLIFSSTTRRHSSFFLVTQTVRKDSVCEEQDRVDVNLG